MPMKAIHKCNCPRVTPSTHTGFKGFQIFVCPQVTVFDGSCLLRKLATELSQLHSTCITMLVFLFVVDFALAKSHTPLLLA